MIIAFAWFFSILAFLLVGIGLLFKDSTFAFAGGSLLIILGLTILGYGLEYDTEKVINEWYVYDNATQYDYNHTVTQYNLLNMTRNETTYFTPKQDNSTFSLGLVYALMGIYFLIWVFIQKKTTNQLSPLPKGEFG